MKYIKFFIFFLIIFVGHAIALKPVKATALDSDMSTYAYPYPVHYYNFNLEKQNLRMAYMDVLPSAHTNGKTIVLFHGGLFFSAYWAQTIQFLSEQGYRVIACDQLGFGKSSKPLIDYSFQQLAKNTHQLLESLNIHYTIILAHSMGGMLAIRYTLMYPQAVSKLILENPIGLEDYRVSIPFKSVDELMQFNLKATHDSIYANFKNYFWRWNDQYDVWADTAYRMTLSQDYPLVAHISALIYEMIYTQPVVYEIARIQVPTLIIVGKEDKTAPGKLFASKQDQVHLGQIAQLARSTARVMPHAKVIELIQVGHIPHLEMPERFQAAIGNFLNS